MVRETIDERRAYAKRWEGGKEESKRTRIDQTIRTSRPIILQLDVA